MTRSVLAPTRLLAVLGPRSPRAAQRSAAAIAAVASAVTGVFTVAGPTPSLLEVLIPVVVGAAALALALLPPERTGILCTLTALFGVAAVTGLDLATHDATAGGQVFFCLPVLYAASQLRPAGALLVTCLAAAGDAVVTTALLPASSGLPDLVYVGATLALISVLLTRAGLEHDRLVQRLTDQAGFDALTGLANRHVLDEAARAALAGSGPDAGTGLVVVDIDHFKTVNDTYGHLVGDDALRHVADLLRALARPDDVVARLGGDELALLLPGSPAGAAQLRAQELVTAVRGTPFRLPDGRLLDLSVSAGAAYAPSSPSPVGTGPDGQPGQPGRPGQPGQPGQGTHLRDLLATADAALYDAKRSGRDRVGHAADPVASLPTPRVPGSAGSPVADRSAAAAAHDGDPAA